MAKKSRSRHARKPQMRRPQPPRALAAAPAPREERLHAAQVTQRPISRREPEPGASAGVNFAQEYRYVISDLKRLGFLALAMFALLVVLAFTL